MAGRRHPGATIRRPKAPRRRPRGSPAAFTLIELPFDKLRITHQRKRFAFTLIELLVVVAILALLVSILAPSLRRARYLARLSQCSANLHSLTVGLTTYATQYRNCYPSRMRIRIGQHLKPTQISAYDGDDRPLLKPFLPRLSVFEDPLAGKVDFVNSTASAAVESNYACWYGWQYQFGGEWRGNVRLGDGFEFEGRTWHVLACDWWVFFPPGTSIQGSHRDRDGVLTLIEWDNASWCFSRWNTWDTLICGEMDQNYAFDDGSVRRLMDLELDDDRLVRVPGWNTGAFWPGAYTWLPPSVP